MQERGQRSFRKVCGASIETVRTHQKSVLGLTSLITTFSIVRCWHLSCTS